MILEEILAEIGDAGRFQIMFILLILGAEVTIAWSMLQVAITNAVPKWWCVDPSTYGLDNMTLDNTTFQICSPPSAQSVLLSNEHVSGYSNKTANFTTENMVAPTEGCVHYFEPGLSTVVSEWDLVCERKHIKAVINAVQMAGVFFGSLISGQVSDTVGRRSNCYVTIAVHGVTCLAAGFSSSWQMYAVFRFCVGSAIGSFIVLHFVYMIEFVRPIWRPYLASIPSWVVGTGMMCLTGWLVPNWRYLHYICAAVTSPFVFGWFVSPESLRWLVAKGRIAEAEMVVNKVAKINRRNKPENISEQLTSLVEEEKLHGDTNQKYSYYTLFCGWKSALKTLIVTFTWMCISMTYYGIVFGVSALSGNIYLNMFLLSAVEAPVTFATACLIIRFGRRWPTFVFSLLASLTGFSILIANRTASEGAKDLVVSAVAICSKMFVGAAWAGMLTFTTELYPTIIRSLGMGWACIAARVGGTVAPFALEMDTADNAIRCYTIIGSIMALTGLSVLFLQETKGKALADTLHQDQKDLEM